MEFMSFIVSSIIFFVFKFKINKQFLSILLLNYSSEILVTLIQVLQDFSPKMTYILEQMALFILTMSLCGTLEEKTIIPFKDDEQRLKSKSNWVFIKHL